MKFLKKKKNRGLALSSSKGFVILFAVMISSIILSITLGMANIALKEINFSSSTKDANDAFYAADVGVECALANDKGSNVFVPNNGTTTIYCFGKTYALSPSNPALTNPPPDLPYEYFWNFTMDGDMAGNTGLGGSKKSCAIVNVHKKTDNNSPNPPVVTTIVKSRGYNIGDGPCNSTNPNRLERELQITY